MSVVERRETESGRRGAWKGTGGALFVDTHDHGRAPRENVTPQTDPKRQQKQHTQHSKKYTIPKQYIFELKQQNKQSKKQKRTDSTTETTQQETHQQNGKNRKQLLMS